MFPYFRKQNGTSIVSVVIIAGIISVVIGSAVSMLSTSFRSISSIHLKGDTEAIRRSILDRVDCDNTIPTQGACPAGDLLLFDKNNHPITDALETASGPFQGSGMLFDQWYLKTTCDLANAT